MTKINKLVMHGFKSFARRTELVFGGQFNCVLGPNGSGKSNILDALCFVLGKSSAKALRTEKSANLIYNGGKSKKPGKSAEVSIYFDNSNKVFPTEDEEVKVTRIVKSNGQSVYKINNEKRTRQQIIELLSLVKVDPDGYNIILQGDITRFVEMSHVDRRLLIEEISGISVYEDKKQKAVNELNKVDEKLREADIILTERKTYLDELKKERDQALEHKELLDKVDRSKATLLYRQIERKRKEDEGYAQSINKYNDKVEQIRKTIEDLQSLVKDKKSEIEKINSEIEQKGEKEQVEIHKTVEKIKIDVATSKDRLKTCKNELNKINDRKKQLVSNIADVEQKIKSLEQEKQAIKKQIETSEKEIQTIDKKISEFKKKHELENIDEIEKEIEELDKKAEDDQKTIQNLRHEQQEFLRNKDKIEFQVQAIDEKIEKVISVEKENKVQVEKLKQMKQEFKKSTLELNTLINDDSSLAAQLGNARQKLHTTNEELSKLNAKSAGMQEAMASDMALRKVLEQKKRIKGIHGTIFQLGEVNSKYALALEVAAGPRIKSVVVDSDRVAAECIKFLKDKKFGIATFLPLNKIKPRIAPQEIAKLKSAAGVHGLAIDLISFDPEYKKAFSYIFGDTLVVDNVDTARRIGVGQVKMVTLDGDVSEISGAMQGGFRRRAGGFSFQEKELSKTIREYEKTVSDTQILISSLEKRKTENEERVARLRELKANLEGEIIKIEKSLNLDSDDITASKKQKQELEKELAAVEKKTSEIQSKIGECNNELAQNKIKKQELREKINALRNPVLIAELNAFEEKKQELKESILKKNLQIENVGKQTSNMLSPEIENIRKVIKQHEKEEEDFKNEIKELNQKIKEFEGSLNVNEKKQQKFYQQFKDLFTKRTKINDEVAKKESKLLVENDNIRKTEQRINAISLDKAKVKAELTAVEQDYERYKDLEIFKNKAEDQLKKDINRAEVLMERMGNINMKALEIYDNILKEYEGLLQKKETLKVEKEDVLIMMNEIESKKKDLFMSTFEVVNKNFADTFSHLSTKGEASMVLEDPEDPFAGGILIKVKLTGNKFMDIRSLSGGEKSMTALAFIFAIQEHDPASFYVLDEVDAALDKRNSEKLAKLVRRYVDRAQYVVISHNDGVISEADTLYGVSMGKDGMSSVVSLKI